MLTNNTMIYQYWGFIIFSFSAICLVAFMLICGFFLGGRSSSSSKYIPFESGINPVGTARLRFSVKFYLIAMFFVIFDVESLYIYTWAVSIRETAWIGFIEAFIFIFTLLIGLFYLINVKAFNWTPKP